MNAIAKTEEHSVSIAAGSVALEGNLVVSEKASGVVLFAHGSGSSRHSPRNQFVARALQEAGLGTLLIDLLTAREEALDARTAQLRFDIEFLAGRLLGATKWLTGNPATRGLPIGYFGASTGAGAALVAAAEQPGPIKAIVSRGGRPDLAGPALPRVKAATMLVVGGEDEAVLPLNRGALERLGSTDKQLVVVPGATHLFEEPGTLDEVARLAAEWFTRYLSR
jgi:dienelactone hydrolase